MNTEALVRERYATAAQKVEPALCCPVDYNREYLKRIPAEVLEKDYGCGDPSQYLKPGETVLDLGAGAGKICFIAAQVVGPTGKVIGVDMTDEMLAVARRNAPVVAQQLGYANVEFRKGRIQDLGLDLERLDEQLRDSPIQGANSFLSALRRAEDQRLREPMIADGSIDVVVSNCVLNLVEPGSKKQLFQEMFRVLRVGGRAVISDIVSDQPVPLHLRQDPHLYSGCISGAFTECEFLQAFLDAGFHGVEIVKWSEKPWQTVEGIEFRSVTVQAFKAEMSSEGEKNHTVIYQGPFRAITDDHGNRFERGKRSRVSEKAFSLLQREPYRASFAFLEAQEEFSPRVAISLNPADCCRPESNCC